MWEMTKREGKLGMGTPVILVLGKYGRLCFQKKRRRGKKRRQTERGERQRDRELGLH